MFLRLLIAVAQLCGCRQYISLHASGERAPGAFQEIFVADKDKLLNDMVELQSQMAFQEDTVSALNEAIAAQQQEILTLRRQLELLKQPLDEQAASAPGTSGLSEEKPPHY